MTDPGPPTAGRTLHRWVSRFYGWAATGLVVLAVGSVLLVGFHHFRAEVLGEAVGDMPFRKVAVRVEFLGDGGPPILTLEAVTLASGAIICRRLEAVHFQPTVPAVGSMVDTVDLAETRTALFEARSAVERVNTEVASTATPLPEPSAAPVTSDAPAAADLPAIRDHQATVRAAVDELRLRRAVAVALYGPTVADWMQAGSAELDPFLQHHASLLLLTPLPGRSASLQPEATVTDRLGQPEPARLVSVAFRIDPRLQDVVGLYRVDDDPGYPRFVPGPAVSARLLVGPVLAGTVAPASAVLRCEGKAWIYVEESPEHFRRREISLEHPLPDGSGWFEERELAVGQTVVTNGGALLLAEER